jgi:hypothetical protein
MKTSIILLMLTISSYASAALYIVNQPTIGSRCGHALSDYVRREAEYQREMQFQRELREMRRQEFLWEMQMRGN